MLAVEFVSKTLVAKRSMKAQEIILRQCKCIGDVIFMYHMVSVLEKFLLYLKCCMSNEMTREYWAIQFLSL